MRLTIDTELGVVYAEDAGETRTIPFDSPEAFDLVSQAYLRVGWDTKHVYTFSWLGRPIIQLPDDMLRVQEAIFDVKPDVIVETGVAHGGSLVYYASLCRAMGRGRVVGIDIEIRPHNREAIEAHPLFDLITLIEGSSTDPDVVREVRSLITEGESALVILDSNHTKDHVLAELEAYADLVTPGSFLVACDGIMADVVGAPRTSPDWVWNNPRAAVPEFLQSDDRFEQVPAPMAFRESPLDEGPSYWRGGWLRRR